MTILDVNNISKIYNPDNALKCVALDGVSLKVEEGDFLVIMGPSGSGKTTLLNNISSIDKPTSGTVQLLGEYIYALDDGALSKLRNQYFGFIFQDFNLIDALTIRENISLPLVVEKGRNLDDINGRINEVANMLGIEMCLEKKAKQCSVGQRQRSAIARALINSPKLIVADEPTGNLDSSNSHEFMKILKKLNKEQNVSIIMVTHDPMIGSYADKLLYIKDGKISNQIERNDMSQQDFYQRIVELSLDNKNIFES